MRHRLISALASAALLAACGGGGGGDGSTGGGPSPSQPGAGGTVPDGTMASVSNFMRFMAAWAADDTVEPLLLSDEEPPTDGGEARPVS